MTSAAKSHVLTACLLIFAQTLAGCAFLLSLDPDPLARVIPSPSDSNAVIVGTKVEVNGRSFSPSYFCREIFFVKLEDGSLDDILQSRILLNAHFRFGYAFLPNAKPGRYAAIGCRFHVGDGVWFEGRRYQTLLLFNRALITRLTRTIAPGTVALLGSIAVDLKNVGRESDFDDAQQHYFRKLEGKDIRTALKEGSPGGTRIRAGGTLKQEYPLDSSSRQFRNILLQDLPTAWKPWFNNSGGPEP
jgi:hypothetical protein